MRISSPQPSVLHLVTLFRMITTGEVRIPAFQRNFVWTEKQMIELLESVNESFPIGSILLWNVDKKVLKIAPSGTSSFPSLAEEFPTNYVLDGMQRLSTLYGVFHHGVTTADPRFDIWFDLKTGLFSHRGDTEPSETSIPLAALFTPRTLLIHQGKIASLNNSDALLDTLLNLQASFQEYMVPVVTIKSPDINRVVGIFEKINSTGTRLDPVDFMRAITWAEDFDLNHYLDESLAAVSDVGATIGSETMIKCVGLVLGIAPTTDGLLQLRTQEPAELAKAFHRAISGIIEVMAFLDHHLNIQSTDLVPYEGQILLLFKAIGLAEATAPDIDALVQWFWAVGFNEGLRGKPDHYVVRAVENWKGLIEGGVRGLEPRLKLTATELLERRIVAGGALSSTYAAMYAANEARDIPNGDYIHPSVYMASNDMSAFQPVFARAELVQGGLPHTISARLFANVVLFGSNTAPDNLRECIIGAAERHDWATLSSQFIDEEAVQALRVNDAVRFMNARVQIMIARAHALVGA
ncbi:DUF262 domain-containing protein [Peteryoungia desertarenae]|uniref:DUF262 domain-containing protein n=1 Tax=Peteryoungia desertarenae TaxID=1813451 RepID=A0ABX6QPT4_9HYPH|nr:DUF262 domain-containing protein [Peteryoungia desertarenae]QLF70524.1 DUF262 domain-containing protein [Peteryoungia desertarenae]